MINNVNVSAPRNPVGLPYSPPQSPADALMNRNMWGAQFANQMNGPQGIPNPSQASGKNGMQGQGSSLGQMTNPNPGAAFDPQAYNNSMVQMNQQLYNRMNGGQNNQPNPYMDQAGLSQQNFSPIPGGQGTTAPSTATYFPPGVSNKGPQLVPDNSQQNVTGPGNIGMGREDQGGGNIRDAAQAMQAPGASWMAASGARQSSKNAPTSGGGGGAPPTDPNNPFRQDSQPAPQSHPKPPQGQNNQIGGNGQQPQQNNGQNWNSPMPWAQQNPSSGPFMGGSNYLNPNFGNIPQSPQWQLGNIGHGFGDIPQQMGQLGQIQPGNGGWFSDITGGIRNAATNYGHNWRDNPGQMATNIGLGIGSTALTGTPIPGMLVGRMLGKNANTGGGGAPPPVDPNFRPGG